MWQQSGHQGQKSQSKVDCLSPEEEPPGKRGFLEPESRFQTRRTSSDDDDIILLQLCKNLFVMLLQFLALHRILDRVHIEGCCGGCIQPVEGLDSGKTNITITDVFLRATFPFTSAQFTSAALFSMKVEVFPYGLSKIVVGGLSFSRLEPTLADAGAVPLLADGGNSASAHTVEEKMSQIKYRRFSLGDPKHSKVPGTDLPAVIQQGEEEHSRKAGWRGHVATQETSGILCHCKPFFKRRHKILGFCY